MPDPAPVIQCPSCFLPMQLADEIRRGETVTARRFICGNHIEPFHLNVHTGDKTQVRRENHHG